jgi:hypothetical protein
MKTFLAVLFCSLLLPLTALALGERSRAQDEETRELRKTVLGLDRAYFEAYNTCDLETQEAMIDEDIEFFHDQSGLTTSKWELLESIEANICGKVTRELVAGSVEVYPIEGYGAVEIGLHRFHNLVEKSTSAPARFVSVWKKGEEGWTLTRVISLHTGPEEK